MAKYYDRHSLGVGSRMKITQIRTGTDRKGLPYWKFYVPFTMRVNSTPVIYKHLWCRVYGRLYVSEGDWVEITKIVAYHPNCRHDNNGGMTVFEDMVVEVERVENDKNKEYLC